jgi:hypothetical protein
VSLADLEAIRVLKARYFRFVDTKEWERFGELFTDDAELDVPLVRAEPLRGRAAIVAAVSGNLAELVTIHHGHAEEVVFAGPDRARAIWPMSDLLLRTTTSLAPPASTGFGPRYEGYGHYVERYARGADGSWRIAHSELRRLHLETEQHHRG